MRRKIFICITIVVIIVMSYFYAHIDKNTYLYNRNTETDEFYGTKVLEEQDEVLQQFVAEENVINGFNIKIYTTGDAGQIELKYALLDENGNVICQESAHGSVLENNKFNVLQLPETKITKGTMYTLRLSVKNSDAENGLGFYIEPNEKQGQNLKITRTEIDGNLVARVISHRFDAETFVMLLGIILFVSAFMKVLYKFFR